MTTDWLSAIGILVAGFIAGLIFVYAYVRRDRRPLDVDVERRDLEAKRDTLVQQLREIDDGDPAAPEEKARLEHEAAEVLRQLDVRDGAAGTVGAAGFIPPKRDEKPKPTTGQQSAFKGFLWGAGSVAALVLLGYFAMRTATPREEAAAPQASAPPAAGSSVEPLEAAVKRNPDDVEARLELAKAYLDRENLIGVFEQTQAILQKTPGDPRAQTYQAIVRVAMGQLEAARTLLDAATKHDPALTEAWVALAWLNTREGKSEDATAAIREAIKRNPREEARLNDVLAQMRTQAVLAPAPAESAAPSSAPAPASSAGLAVRVVLQLDASVRVPQSGVIFVIARAAGVTSGPPAAVKRVPLGAFPVTVDLSAADSMMGQPLPAQMRIEARIDSDGVGTTRAANDPAGAVEGVRVGERVTVVLR